MLELDRKYTAPDQGFSGSLAAKLYAMWSFILIDPHMGTACWDVRSLNFLGTN